jgi:hypothetical protein
VPIASLISSVAMPIKATGGPAMAVAVPMKKLPISSLKNFLNLFLILLVVDYFFSSSTGG